VLHHIVKSLKENGITLVFSGLKKQILDVMRTTHLFDQVGSHNIFATNDMALKNIYQRLGKSGSDAVLLPAGV
jgi:sulfate permease, SulP family